MGVGSLGGYAKGLYLFRIDYRKYNLAGAGRELH